MEPSCHGVLRSLARFRALARVGAVSVLFPSSVVSSISVCASGHLMRHVQGSRHSAKFTSHLVVRTHPDVSVHHCFHVREIRALSHRYHVGDDSQRSSATMLRVHLFRYQAVRSPPVSVFTTLVPQSCWGDLHTCCSHCVSRVACRLRARVVVVEPPTAS